jgi:hypothetical protein
MNRKIMIAIMAIIFVMSVVCSSYFSKPEGFENYTLDDATGYVPADETNVLVQDTYPITGINGISNNGSNDIWWWYPTFKLGSYAQITNNIRYPSRPDEGTCMPASMCGSLYKKKHIRDNHVYSLPPVNQHKGTRIGYFTTPSTNLVLPFKSVVTNL